MALTMVELATEVMPIVCAWATDRISARHASYEIWSLTAGEALPQFDDPTLESRLRALLSSEFGLTYPVETT